jgi:hypothetical protein
MPPFQVAYLEAAKTALKDICDRAAVIGLEDAVLNAARKIDARLRNDPRSFGEPKHRFKELQLVLHCAIVSPLVVHFTVHQELPNVFVKSINPLPGKGL